MKGDRSGSSAAAVKEAGARQAEDREAAVLVAQAQSGDRRAFTQLYSRYFDRVYGYLRLLLKDRHEAEDLAQQVFLRAYEALPSYREQRSFWVWLFIIARNHAFDQLKKQSRVQVEEPVAISRRQDRSSPGTARPEALSEMPDGTLIAFVERLPLAQRQVVALRYMLDLANPEIAAILDRTPQEVALLHHRALKFLKVRLSSTRGRAGHGRAPSRRPVKVAPVIRSRRFVL